MDIGVHIAEGTALVPPNCALLAVERFSCGTVGISTGESAVSVHLLILAVTRRWRTGA